MLLTVALKTHFEATVFSGMGTFVLIAIVFVNAVGDEHVHLVM
jgi:hypothetical protein